ncbi:MAG: LPS export ABC transporter permease LptF [Acidobacteriia bacterium]|nr:LPS export ABC transporter permease LptF [Terriglobia bacterium]
MRIISRAIFREALFPSFLGLMVFTFILFIRDLGKLLEMIVSSTASVALIGKLCLLLLPNIFMFTIPMGILLGILVGLGRMSADSEVVALRASGRSIATFVWPVVALGLLAGGINLFLSTRGVPYINQIKQSVLDQVASSQIGAELAPRVFEERFPKLILYVEDIVDERWKNIFMVDMTKPDSAPVTLAQHGELLVNRSQDKLQLYLERGSSHLLSPNKPSDYSLIHFDHSEIPLPPIQVKRDTSLRATLPDLPTLQLFHDVRRPRAPRAMFVELHRRFALPASCLVLALLGVPLGISSQRGGKSYGFILSLLVISAYYLMFVTGTRFADDGRIPVVLGLWGANAVFFVLSIILIFLSDRHWLAGFRTFLAETSNSLLARLKRLLKNTNNSAHRNASPFLRLLTPHIIDEYILRGFFGYLLLSLLAFIMIFIIFTLFELISDIVRNHVSPMTVILYFVYLIPQIIYWVAPIAVLVATLVNFGLLTKTNQITAMKASGLSLYRLSVSLLFSAALISVGMFLLQDFVLPGANQHQDAYRNIIKGRPPQTFLRPNQNWIVGQDSKQLRIYNYKYYDPDRAAFADFSVYEIDPTTNHMSRRIASRHVYWDSYLRHWVFDDGWVRDFSLDDHSSFRSFTVTTFAEVNEEPGYFVKIVKLSEQMNAGELWRYIQSLQQSGFDVVRLMVQYYRKFAYPMIAFIMVLLAIPFSFSTGRRGALYGIGLSIGIAILYWAVGGLFEAMGGFNKLHPMLAAWSPNLIFGLGGIYLLLTIDT